MSAPPRRWTIHIAAAAKLDIRAILGWTAAEFGEIQANAYAATLFATIDDLGNWPSIAGVKERSDILEGLLTLHVARKRRKGRHFIAFRISSNDTQAIEVLRVLHDAMDLPCHLSRDDA